MKKFVLILVTLCIIAITSIVTTAQTTIGDDAALIYKVRTANKRTQTPPVVILLHGMGSNEEDLFHYAHFFPTNYMVVSARAPIDKGNHGYVWFQVEYLPNNSRRVNQQEELKSRQLIRQLIREVTNKYHADSNNVFLVGFSQGAMMTYSVGLTAPEKIKGIVSMGGKMLDYIQASAKKSLPNKNLKVLIAHGTQDPTMPLNYATDSQRFFTQIGLQSELKTYPIPHTVSEDEIKEMVTWIEKVRGE